MIHLHKQYCQKEKSVKKKYPMSFYSLYFSKPENWLLREGEVKVLVAQSYLTFCNPMDCSLPGSSGHGILQARYCSGLSFPSPGDLPNPRIEPRSPTLQADSLRSEPPGRFSG